MADKKEYTPQEVAEAILKKCQEILETSKLAKANTAHEVESGAEASNSEAECPEQLTAGEVAKEGDQEKKKKKLGESEEESEEESDEEESDEEEESEEESDEEEESEEDKKEKKMPFDKKEDKLDKSEHMLKEEGMSVEEAVDKIMSDKHEVHDVMDKLHSSKRSKVLSALRSKDTKKAEMCKAYMAKCGDMKAMGKNEKLKGFLDKRKKKLKN